MNAVIFNIINTENNIRGRSKQQETIFPQLSYKYICKTNNNLKKFTKPYFTSSSSTLALFLLTGSSRYIDCNKNIHMLHDNDVLLQHTYQDGIVDLCHKGDSTDSFSFISNR